MAGTAKTTKFLLGTATVMIGPMANLFNFTPALNGIGLVKNFQVTAEPQSIDLTQGVHNNLVYSIVTGADPRASMEVFEYTAANLAYGLGLDGSTYGSFAVSTTTSGLTDGSPTPTSTVNVVSATGLAVNDYIAISDDANGDDIVITRKITAIVSLALTVSPAVGVDIPTGATVKKVNNIPVGKPTDGLFLAAKVVGLLADGTQCIMLFPKIRITRGFTLGFQVNDYGNLPFEFKTLDLVSTDANFSEFVANSKGAIFVQA